MKLRRADQRMQEMMEEAVEHQAELMKRTEPEFYDRVISLFMQQARRDGFIHTPFGWYHCEEEETIAEWAKKAVRRVCEQV